MTVAPHPRQDTFPKGGPTERSEVEGGSPTIALIARPDGRTVPRSAGGQHRYPIRGSPRNRRGYVSWSSPNY